MQCSSYTTAGCASGAHCCATRTNVRFTEVKSKRQPDCDTNGLVAHTKTARRDGRAKSQSLLWIALRAIVSLRQGRSHSYSRFRPSRGQCQGRSKSVSERHSRRQCLKCCWRNTNEPGLPYYYYFNIIIIIIIIILLFLIILF